MTADLKTRLTGIGLIIAGLVLGYIGVVEPIMKAEAQVERINLFGIGPFLVGPLIVIGLVLVAMGASADARLRDAEAKKITPLGNVLFAIAFLAGLATLLGPKLLVQSMGYQP